MVALVALLSSSIVYAAGFTLGPDYTATEIWGDVTLYCNDRGYTRTEHIYCHDYTLDPVEFDYFVWNGDETVAADQVKLTNVVGGKQRTQTKPYSTELKRSTKHFNLWIATLLQTPLLGTGSNEVSYEMSLNKNVTKAGTFVVNVERGRDRTCRHGFFHHFGDCRTISDSQICSQYFREENFCQ